MPSLVGFFTTRGGDQVFAHVQVEARVENVDPRADLAHVRDGAGMDLDHPRVADEHHDRLAAPSGLLEHVAQRMRGFDRIRVLPDRRAAACMRLTPKRCVMPKNWCVSVMASHAARKPATSISVSARRAFRRGGATSRLAPATAHASSTNASYAAWSLCARR